MVGGRGPGSCTPRREDAKLRESVHMQICKRDSASARGYSWPRSRPCSPDNVCVGDDVQRRTRGAHRGAEEALSDGADVAHGNEHVSAPLLVPCELCVFAAGGRDSLTLGGRTCRPQGWDHHVSASTPGAPHQIGRHGAQHQSAVVDICWDRPHRVLYRPDVWQAERCVRIPQP